MNSANHTSNSSQNLFERLRLASKVWIHGFVRTKNKIAATKVVQSVPGQLAVRVVQQLGKDDATHMAASVSYYAILSLFPLLLGLSSAVGLVSSSARRQQQ